MSKVSELIKEQDQLKHELVIMMVVLVSNNEAEIAFLKVELLRVQIEGPSTEVIHDLQKQNDELIAEVVSL